MKQLKFSNPRLQRAADWCSGWREVGVCAGLIVVVLLLWWLNSRIP